MRGYRPAIEINRLDVEIVFGPEAGLVDGIVEDAVKGNATCIIKDSGPGFTADDRLKMFRRYGRLSARPTGNEPSTGLGLSIVKRLVDAMGGTISLTDGKAPGAEFVITMPAATEATSSD